MQAIKMHYGGSYLYTDHSLKNQFAKVFLRG